MRISALGLAVLLGCLLWGVGDIAAATTYGASGTVAILRSHDAAVSEDWFTLTGVASLGTCPTLNGQVLFVLRDDERAWRHFALVLSAKRAGTPVSVWADDTVLNHAGFCYLQYMQ
ncbi:MAG: hypothetical protein ACJ8R9_02780 [Steroidobacteraceae bacterium]